MPDLAVFNDIEIIAKVQKAAEILKIFKVHTYGNRQGVLEATIVHEVDQKDVMCPERCILHCLDKTGVLYIASTKLVALLAFPDIQSST